MKASVRFGSQTPGAVIGARPGSEQSQFSAAGATPAAQRRYAFHSAPQLTDGSSKNEASPTQSFTQRAYCRPSPRHSAASEVEQRSAHSKVVLSASQRGDAELA